MTGYQSRRKFIAAAAAGGTVIASSASAAEKKRKKYKRKSPSATELIEIGMLSTGGYSHADVWGKAMNPPLEEFNGDFLPRMTGMVMTMCWDPEPELAEAYAKKFGLKVVKNYYDMVDRVDGIITADYDITGWMPQLSKPYLEAGMPFLVERPLALSLREAKEIVGRSKKYGAPIYVPSAYETRFETIRAREKLKELLDKGAYITGVVATQAAKDYPAHGNHGIYKLYTMLNPNVVEAGFLSDDWWAFNSALMTWRCSQKGHPDYFVGLQFSGDGWTIINTSKGQITENIDTTRYEPYNRSKWHNTPNMYEFAKMVETGKMPQSHDYIMAKTTTLLTGFYSHLEKNGDMVKCSELPENWRAPDRFTGRTFKNHRDPAPLDELFG